VPASLAAVVRKAMAFDREQRYPSVAALQADLAAYQGGFATAAENASAWKQFTLLVKRHKATTIGLAAVVLTGTVLGTKAIVEGRRAEREAMRANKALADLKKSVIAAAVEALRVRRAETELKFRGIVHHGTVSVGGAAGIGEESLMGPEVNFIFRVEKIAGGMGAAFCFTEAAQALLAPALGLEPIPGRHALKGFPGD
jgi:hypothetical protein